MLSDIINLLKFFETKDNGSYEDTFVKKEAKIEEELRDEFEWEYLISKLKPNLPPEREKLILFKSLLRNLLL